jgi:hypothetical protein
MFNALGIPHVWVVMVGVSLGSVMAIGCGSVGSSTDASSGDASDTSPLPDTSETKDTAEKDAYSLCTPNSTICYSDLMIATCDAFGQSYTGFSDCPEGTICMADSGSCAFPFCYPGAEECVDYWHRRECDVTGGFWMPAEACGEDKYCDAGKCVACVPGEFECVDDLTERQCGDDGLTWLDPVPCPTEQSCIDGRCYTCSPGKAECLDDHNLRVCNDSGVGWSEYTVCTDDELCIDGACAPCKPKSTCVTPNSYIRECTDESVSWSETVVCENQYFCVGGKCLYEGCFSDVLLLVDRSGSMSGSWKTVQNSVTSLISGTDFARFGLMAFPSNGSCNVAETLDVPWTLGDSDPFNQWFQDHNATGSTPLVDAVGNVLTYAPLLFGEKGGVLVVLSDGGDTCFNEDKIYALTNYAAALFVNFNVVSYVIGYNFAGNTDQLNAIAANGGSEFKTYFPAGNEEELSKAFDSIVGDLKLCD